MNKPRRTVPLRTQIEAVAGRIARYQWYVDHPRIEDGRCRSCGTLVESCTCIDDAKRNLVYAVERLAVLRAESTLTPEVVEEILEGCRRFVERREREEMVERRKNK